MESIQAAERINEMWERLGTQFADSVPDHVIAGDAAKAIKAALCAEACFWKSTGEADTHDVKDVLPILAVSDAEREAEPKL
jgi:hypothetical protein